MRALRLAVFAEGPTDYEFLSPVLLRLAADLIEKKGRHPADVLEPLKVPGRPTTDVFRQAAQRCAQDCDVLIVHSDGAGQPERTLLEKVDPWLAAVQDLFDGQQKCVVAIVPVRETEAWMLSDFHALNAAFGTRLTPAEFGLAARPHEVEAIWDPKAELERVHRMAVGDRQARRLGRRPLYRRIGLEVDLGVLCRVPAFLKFYGRFERALRDLTYLISGYPSCRPDNRRRMHASVAAVGIAATMAADENRI